ncbi:MAG: UTRA domain-containing protein [Cyanobacteria bacterium P01_F01_bin.56]
MSARLPQAQPARILRMPAIKPSLLSESINVDHSRRVVEYGVTRLRGDRMERLMEND